MLTLSIIKADTGGFVGHSGMHPEMLRTAREAVVRATHGDLLIDAQVASCGDDISLIMTHRRGIDAEPVHTLAWDIFQQTTVIDPKMHAGFSFEVHDHFENQQITFDCPAEPLIGPRDMFDDPAFDRSRAIANEEMDYLRRHGPFEPHRLPLDEMEYTTMPSVVDELGGRWTPIPNGSPVAARS